MIARRCLRRDAPRSESPRPATLLSLALREKRALNEYRSVQTDVAAPADAAPDPSSALALWDEDDEDEVDPEVHKIFQESADVRKICSNPGCLRTKNRGGSGHPNGENFKMLQCSRCTVAMYCSVGYLTWTILAAC